MCLDLDYRGLSSGNRFRKIFGILDYRGLSSGNRFILCRVFNKLFLGLLANERKGVGKRKDKQVKSCRCFFTYHVDYVM